jgi:uncharacterized protein
LSNAELVVFSNVDSDAAIAVRTVQDHFQLLEDTLLGRMLPALRRSKRKAIATGKFYFFDPGVAHCLLGRTTVAPRTPEHGRAFEHLLFCELRAHLSYARLAFTWSHFRTATGSEIDFILDRKSSIVAIEAKAKKHVTEQDLKGLRAFKDEHPKTICYVVCGRNQRHEQRRTASKLCLCGCFSKNCGSRERERCSRWMHRSIEEKMMSPGLKPRVAIF